MTAAYIPLSSGLLWRGTKVVWPIRSRLPALASIGKKNTRSPAMGKNLNCVRRAFFVNQWTKGNGGKRKAFIFVFAAQIAPLPTLKRMGRWRVKLLQAY